MHQDTVVLNHLACRLERELSLHWSVQEHIGRSVVTQFQFEVEFIETFCFIGSHIVLELCTKKKKEKKRKKERLDLYRFFRRLTRKDFHRCRSRLHRYAHLISLEYIDILCQINVPKQVFIESTSYYKYYRETIFFRLLLHCCYYVVLLSKYSFFICVPFYIREFYIRLSSWKIFIRNRKLYFSVYYRWGTITAICFLPATDIPINIKTAHPRRRDPASGVAFTARFGSKYIHTRMPVSRLVYMGIERNYCSFSLCFRFLYSPFDP